MTVRPAAGGTGEDRGPDPRQPRSLDPLVPGRRVPAGLTPPRPGRAARSRASSPSASPFLLREPGPVPDAVRHLSWESVSQLARSHAELASVVPLVGGEVAQEVIQVPGEAWPGRPWEAPSMRHAQVQEPDHSIAAAGQRLRELQRSDSPGVDATWWLDAVAAAEALDPAAAAVVDVCRNHSNGHSGNARHLAPPDGRRQIVDEKHGRTVVGPPRGHHAVGSCSPGHAHLSPPDETPCSLDDPSVSNRHRGMRRVGRHSIHDAASDTPRWEPTGGSPSRASLRTA